MGLFDDKVAVVTGAGRGIGRAEALLLAAEGAAVVVNDLGGAADGSAGDGAAGGAAAGGVSQDGVATGAAQPGGAAQQVVAEIEAAGGRAAANTDSVASWAGAEALIASAVEHFGRLDVVINNAGILRDRVSFNMTEEEWDSVIAVHLKGHFAVARHAAAYWRARAKETGEPAGAALVNTTSESGLYGNGGQANYAAAKAGIASLTLVLARELERIGVRVNAIAPVARTRLTEAVAGEYMQPDESGFDRFDPANVAAVAAWLACDRAAGISGQVVKVQGGMIQLLEGWRPLTEVTDDKPWTIDSVADRGTEILGPTTGSVPAFFFPSPPADRSPYPGSIDPQAVGG